jgi:UDP-GlcNAc:undecaprenyl-phosphate/decaprenyl-phosphate GlcNAc-1-phosphate transferase
MARSRRVAASAVTALAAGAAARAAYAALTRVPPGGAARWTRTNHRGEPVTLLEGPAAAIAGTMAAATAPGVPGRCRAAMAVAAAGAAAFGGYDDIAGSGDRRGFRGHLGALARGEVTTGAVKIGGIGATGIAAAAVNGGPAADVAINAALVAGTANLLNLFDLRPGRAIKVVLAAGGPLAAAGAPVAAPLGAALALLPEDLGERAMLGDAGANALGAMLGAAAAGRLSRTSRLAILAGATALTAASEVVSFTKVIQRTPALNWLDMLGRRPPAVPAAAPPATAAPAAAPPATGSSTMGSPATGAPAGTAEPGPEPVPGAGPHFP